MYFFKHPNGRYYLAYVDQQGRQIRVSAKTRKKAEAWKFLKEFKADQRAKTSKSPTWILTFFIVFSFS
ncbi:MAG: hypothetical protein KDC45_02435 [Bacteroidetes bacterium]|nr:hypothetical protein [Bacteroidota bacterium]